MQGCPANESFFLISLLSCNAQGRLTVFKKTGLLSSYAVVLKIQAWFCRIWHSLYGREQWQAGGGEVRHCETGRQALVLHSLPRVTLPAPLLRDHISSRFTPLKTKLCMNFVGTPLQCSQCIIIPLTASLTLKRPLFGGKRFPPRQA